MYVINTVTSTDPLPKFAERGICVSGCIRHTSVCLEAAVGDGGMRQAGSVRRESHARQRERQAAREDGRHTAADVPRPELQLTRRHRARPASRGMFVICWGMFIASRDTSLL